MWKNDLFKLFILKIMRNIALKMQFLTTEVACKNEFYPLNSINLLIINT